MYKVVQWNRTWKAYQLLRWDNRSQTWHHVSWHWSRWGATWKGRQALLDNIKLGEWEIRP